MLSQHQNRARLISGSSGSVIQNSTGWRFGAVCQCTTSSSSDTINLDQATPARAHSALCRSAGDKWHRVLHTSTSDPSCQKNDWVGNPSPWAHGYSGSNTHEPALDSESQTHGKSGRYRPRQRKRRSALSTKVSGWHKGMDSVISWRP